MKGEKERFEEWWAIAMGTSMKGSKYLARNAWIAALWEYGVVTMKGALIESSGDKAVPASDRLTVQYANAPTIKKDLTVAPLPAEVEAAMERMDFAIGDAYSARQDLTTQKGYTMAKAKEDCDMDHAALAVIRAALSKGIEVEP